MVGNFVSFLPEHLLQYSPVLEAVVDRLLSVSNSLLHVFSFLWIGETLRTLDILWGVSNIPIVSLNSFIWTKVRSKTVAEDRNVVETATGEGSIDPNNVSSEDAESNFIAKCRLHSVLVRGKCWSKLRHWKVSAINRNKAVIALVIF
jgi:hypothetical protein